MAVQRRVVWFSDEEWIKLGEMAQTEGKTISAFMRDRLVGRPTAPKRVK